MKWASGISEQTSLAGAIEECTAQVRQQLGEGYFWIKNSKQQTVHLRGKAWVLS